MDKELSRLQVFVGLCIAFKALLDGFMNGCKPLIGLDGCFLKGKYGGLFFLLFLLMVIMVCSLLQCMWLKRKIMNLGAHFFQS